MYLNSIMMDSIKVYDVYLRFDMWHFRYYQSAHKQFFPPYKTKMQMPEKPIIGDAAIQQLSLDFTFDETHQDKLIVNLVADHIHYQL